MSNKKLFTQELANALLVGHWTINDLCDRLTHSLGYFPGWAKPLVVSIYHQFKQNFPRIKNKQLALFICQHPLFDDAWRQYRIENGQDLLIRNYTLQFAESVAPVLACDIPHLNTIKDLAGWLGLSSSKLEGYADRRGLERKSASERQRHYHYIWKKKASGSARLLEVSMLFLKLLDIDWM